MITRRYIFVYMHMKYVNKGEMISRQFRSPLRYVCILIIMTD